MNETMIVIKAYILILMLIPLIGTLGEQFQVKFINKAMELFSNEILGIMYGIGTALMTLSFFY